MTGTPWRVILAAEGPSDHRRIGVLVDHFMGEKCPDTPRETLFRFEPVDSKPYVPSKSIPDLNRECKLNRRFDKLREKGDGESLRMLYNILKHKKLLGPRTVVIWSRDDDGDGARRSLVKRARDNLQSSTPILLAIASECGEAWVITGWRAVIDDAAKAKALQSQLGFHPDLQPDKLSHKEDAPKSAKGVLEEVFSGNRDKEDEALIAAAEAKSLASRLCGLADFCDEVEAWLSSATGGGVHAAHH